MPILYKDCLTRMKTIDKKDFDKKDFDKKEFKLNFYSKSFIQKLVAILKLEAIHAVKTFEAI